MSLSTIPADAPRRLLAGPDGLEVVWVREDAKGLHVVSTLVSGAGQKQRELFVLSGPSKVLRFDAVRDSAGTYHVAALTSASDRVAVLAARYGGGRPVVAELMSVPSTGTYDTSDGKIGYPKVEDYESLRVVVRNDGTTVALWTDGRVTLLETLDHGGHRSEEALPGPARRATVAVDETGKIHVLSVGQKSCVAGGIFCNEEVSYLVKVGNEWKQTSLGKGEEGVPELVVAGNEPPKALLVDDYAHVLDPSVSGVRALAYAGRSLQWAKPVSSSTGPWLVGFSSAGTLHAVSLTGKVREKVMPLLDLSALDPESTNLDAAAVGEDIYVLASSRGATELRRLHPPAKSEHAPEVEFTELRPRHVRLGDRDAFGDFEVLPHSGPYAGFYRVIDANCRAPISESLKVPFDPVLVPRRDALRVFGSGRATSWEFKEYRFLPSGVSEPGQNPPSEAGRTWTTSAECPDRKIFRAAPTLVRTEALEFPRDAEWVGQDEGAVYALVSAKDGFSLHRFAWNKTPLSPELIGNIESGADSRTLVIQRNREGQLHAMYGLPAKHQVVVWIDGQVKARVEADQGAFAFVLDAKGAPAWVVRRGEKLFYERLEAKGVAERVLGETDALPLAAMLTEAGQLLVALEVAPSQAPVIASFGEGSGWSAVLGSRCGRGELQNAKFLTSTVVALGCDYSPESE